MANYQSAAYYSLLALFALLWLLLSKVMCSRKERKRKEKTKKKKVKKRKVKLGVIGQW